MSWQFLDIRRAAAAAFIVLLLELQIGQIVGYRGYAWMYIVALDANAASLKTIQSKCIKNKNKHKHENKKTMKK